VAKDLLRRENILQYAKNVHDFTSLKIKVRPFVGVQIAESDPSVPGYQVRRHVMHVVR